MSLTVERAIYDSCYTHEIGVGVDCRFKGKDGRTDPPLIQLRYHIEHRLHSYHPNYRQNEVSYVRTCVEGVHPDQQCSRGIRSLNSYRPLFFDKNIFSYGTYMN